MDAVNLTPAQSEDLIYQTLVNNGISGDLATIITAQSGHETNGWTSNVYLTDNNAFGYGFTGTSYKTYSDVEKSVLDLIGYLQRKVANGSFPPLDQITTPEQYAQLLASVGYYTDNESNYLTGIERWLNNNLGTVAAVTAGSGLVIFLVILGIAFFIKK